MSCRKHSPGKPCCVPPDCVSKCNAYIPATTWPVTFLGRTVTLYQHPTYKCFYSADDCVLESVVEEDSWTITGDWEGGQYDGIPDPCRCAGVEYDFVERQVKFRASVKRFSQVRRYASIQIYPSSPTSNLLKVYIRYELSKTYFHGASWSAQNRWRVSTITCPSTRSTGAWNEGSVPTMLSVEKPSFFTFGNGSCGYPSFSNFTTCAIELGSVVTPTTWGTHSIGSFRSLNTDCTLRSEEYFISDDMSVRKSTGLPPRSVGGSYSTGWTPCTTLDGGINNETCDRQVRYLRNYESATFDCASIPSTISCSSGFSTIPSTSGIEPCGSRDLSFSFPTVPGSLTVTL